MNRVVLATESAQLAERMHEATAGGCLTLPLGPLPADPAQLIIQLAAVAFPEVVVLDARSDAAAAMNLATNFNRQFPSVSIILVTDAGPALALAAMRAGVRDLMHPAAPLADIQLVLDRAGKSAQAHLAAMAGTLPTDAGPAAAGRVIGVVSPKGGVGKTTVATNLAVGLAQSQLHSTVLVDLDVQFGDVAYALNLEPEYSLPDAVHGPASRDTMALKTFLTRHETGLYVICGPKTPAAADSVSPEQVSHLLRMLASEFRYVVVDTAPGLQDHALAAIDESTDLVLLTSMDVPGVRGLRRELDALSSLGMSAKNCHVVLNFVDERGDLSVQDVVATIGTGIDLLLPRSKSTLESVNQGIPLLQARGRDPMTKQLRRLVGRFTPTTAPMTRKERAALDRAEAALPETRAHARRAAPRWYRVRRAAA
jgi:pilus assembly protein CpaE